MSGQMRLRSMAALAIAAIILAAPPPAALHSSDVLNHLNQTIAWYRHVQNVEQTSDDVLLRDSILRSALKTVQLGFDFARAAAGLVEAAPQQNSQGPDSFERATTQAADRVNNVEARISALDDEVRKAPPRRRATLEAQRAELNSELELAKQVQSTINTLSRFNGNSQSVGGTGGLLAQITELEQSVPEAQRGAGAPTAPAARNSTPAQSLQPESLGIVGLIGDVFTLSSRRNQIADLQKQTDALLADIGRLRTPFRNETRNSIQRADAITNSAAPSNASDAENARHEVAALSARFKQLSAAMVPLSEQAIEAAHTRTGLQDSINDLDTARGAAARYLLLRGAVIATVIFVILAVSGLWRRATFRYVTDVRRRRQFLTLRRIAVSLAVLLTVIFGFVSEFGSLATYAGFVTAGIALALQNPILAVVGYFFLIGRHGVRVGDRVTITNVTGEVMDIGLVRIYLMELAPDGHPTGRVVVFSNSVIFQPAALYRQMPGLDYAWHSATLTLSGAGDFQLAETRLREAVDSVYQDYREKFERQHKYLQQSTDLNVSAPRPDFHLRYTDAGIEVTVRYPVILREGTATDDRIMKALHDAIEREPKLQFAPSGRPKVQLAA